MKIASTNTVTVESATKDMSGLLTDFTALEALKEHESEVYNSRHDRYIPNPKINMLYEALDQRINDVAKKLRLTDLEIVSMVNDLKYQPSKVNDFLVSYIEVVNGREKKKPE
jgi:hypothetical protein